jgi:hypothetical protein
MRANPFVSVALAAVAVFAAGARAQGVPPSEAAVKELAKIVAVEEQERDLAKAESLYREALAGKALSEEARTLANARLAALLTRLGRAREAEPFAEAAARGEGAVVTLDDVVNGLVTNGQDTERTKALRAKARELVQRLLATTQGGGGTEVWSQLQWVGDPAVPEIAAALEASSTQASTVRPQIVSGLAGLLWGNESEAAAAHLRRLAASDNAAFREVLYEAAGSAVRGPRAARAAIAMLVAEPLDELAAKLVGPAWLAAGAETAIAAAETKGPAVRAEVLNRAHGAKLRRPVLARLHAMVRAARREADPSLTRATQRFVCSNTSQESPEGVELLIEMLPELQYGPNAAQPTGAGLPAEWRQSGDNSRLTPAAAAHLWPLLVAAARAVPPVSPQANWLAAMLERCAQELDARIVPDAIAIAERIPFAPNQGLIRLFWGKVTPANAAAVLSLWEPLTADHARAELLDVLANAELPIELYEPLSQRGTPWAGDGPEQTGLLLRALVATGHPDAAPRVLDWWRERKDERAVKTASNLLRLGARTRDERVRAGMREVAGHTNSKEQRSRLLLALLSMHDAAALELLALPNQDAVRHPYAAKKPHESAMMLTPLQYLLYRDPDPPHGFTEAEIVAVLQRHFAERIPRLLPEQFSIGAIPDTVLGELARLLGRGGDGGGGNPQGWVGAALRRARDGDASRGALRDWARQQLQSGEVLLQRWVLMELTDDQLQALREPVEALIQGEDHGIAELAARRLLDAAVDLPPEKLARHPHPDVRELLPYAVVTARMPNAADHVVALLADPDPSVRRAAASAAGVVLAKDAVPQLLPLLRDPDEAVRKAAADALTRIRFFHEQQAHWDRVLKGLDASPASAAEKLLLQGKPGAPKEQRLLAIQSLGTLGVPEALPFLIEWSQDADPDVAKRAKDAITQIHLHPRR